MSSIRSARSSMPRLSRMKPSVTPSPPSRDTQLRRIPPKLVDGVATSVGEARYEKEDFYDLDLRRCPGCAGGRGRSTSARRQLQHHDWVSKRVRVTALR